MQSEAADLARRAAASLAPRYGNALPTQVESAIQGGAAGQRFIGPLTIALATLILNVAKFGWDIYRDTKKSAASPPAPQVIARRIRLEVELPDGVTEAQRDQVAAAVIAELPKS